MYSTHDGIIFNKPECVHGENIANVEDWIYIIKNSKYFITDSFHGICFSIIFNIPFICVLNEYAGKSRIKSLSKMLRFEDRIINDITSKIDDKLIDMDFSNINEIMEVEKERSLKWLKNSLEANKILKKDYYRDSKVQDALDLLPLNDWNPSILLQIQDEKEKRLESFFTFNKR